jgi:hypothetical protein
MKPKPPKARQALQFELSGPASPDRVARAARALSEAVRAVAPNLGDGDITMVVKNRAMHGELRTWTRPAEEAAATALRFLDKPKIAIAKVERGRDIARRLEAPLRVLAEENTIIRKPRTQRVLKKLTLAFVDQLAFLAELPPESLVDRLRGGDVVVTPILRIGRKREGAATMARITVAPEKHEEIRVPDELASAFFDAAKDGGIFAVTVEVTWCRNSSGRLRRDFQEAIAKGIVRTRLADMSEAIRRFQAEAPEAFADFDDAVDSIRDL